MQIGLGLWLGTRQVGDGSSLNLNFLSGSLDSRITFTRTTTATVVGSNGLVQSAAINAPRFDYDPVTLAPRGILIEEQRTNLLTYSEQFDNAVWTKNASSVTANSSTAPDGTTTADTITDTVTNDVHVAFQSVSVASAITYTFSAYVKAGTLNHAMLRIGGNAFGIPSPSVKATLTGSGSVTVLEGSVTNPTIVAVGGGWYRVSFTSTTVSSVFTAPQVGPHNNGATAIYTGSGTGTVLAWGAQLEAGAFATSYIPTVASQVTRTADLASIVAPMFAPWYNQSEGTFVVEANIPANRDEPSGNHYFSVSDGGTSNTIGALDINGTRGIVSTGGVTQFDSTVGAEPTSTVKFALAFATNNTVLCVGGVLGTVDTAVTLPAVNALAIGVRSDFSSTTYANGHIRNITYYPVRLSDLQLQALTQ